MTHETNAGVPERILTQATYLFVTQGYHGISMREIAQAVGVSKAGLYYHFKDKEDLFIAILVAYLERIERDIDEAQTAGPTARAQIAALMAAIFAQAPDQRAIIRLASQEMAHLSRESRERFGQIYQAKFIGKIEAILQEGIASGELRSMNAALGTWILLGMMYPFFYPAHERALGPAAEAIELMLEIFFEGANPPRPIIARRARPPAPPPGRRAPPGPPSGPS